MLAAEHLEQALKAGRAHDEVVEYDSAWRASDIGRDLKPVRNVKPLLSKYGLYLGVLLGGFDMWTNELFGFSVFGTLPHGKPDHASLKPLEEAAPKTYPKLPAKIVFDKLSSVFVSNTNHEEDQPCHLKLEDPAIPIRDNLPRYGEPARLYCPAGVYEVVYADEATKTGPRFVINAQNCVHCKTCDIKDPAQNITWVPPEGGGGPNYPNM
jgi:electron-transferring-flavoprotein dehydrogenase